MSIETTTVAALACPHCEAALTPEEIKRLWSIYTSSQRQTMGGPKRVKRPCPACGMACDTARGAWNHCRIPLEMDADVLLDYVLERMPKEVASLLPGPYATLEALQDAVIDIQGALPPKSAETRQSQWYRGFVDKAMERLENAA